jgi:CheY-like chemotaxis protein
MSMLPPEGIKRRVLFVDDEPAFLDMIAQAFTYWGAGLWEIHQAVEVSQALRVLQQHKIDLVVVDIRMPTVDGIQLLRLMRRKYPQLLKAVLTGYGNEEYRAACLAEGAELFLEKPRSPDGLQSLYAALTELVKWQPEQGFRGVLRKVSLEDVLQMECLGRNSSVLEVTAGSGRGQIFVKDGSIIHAQIGGIEGDAAFHQILDLRGGEFQLKPYADPPQTTIQGQWEYLLMEAARKRDEASQSPHDQAEPDQLAESQTSAVVDDWGPPGVLPADQAVLNETIVQPTGATPPPEWWADAPGAAALGPATPLTSRAHTPLPPLFTTAEERAKRELLPTRIDELLVSSAQGEVLYHWQCPEPDARVGFLEFLSLRSRQLSHGFPLGRFDRLEMQAERGRAVAQVQADRGVVIRSSQGNLSMRK